MQTDLAEFDPCHYDLLQRLSGRMKWAGCMLLVYVCFSTIQTILEFRRSELAFFRNEPIFQKILALGMVIEGISFVGLSLLGIWTLRSSREFLQIVETRGDDLTHLMRALRHLLKVYSFIYWYLVLSLLLMALWMLFGLQIMQSLHH